MPPSPASGWFHSIDLGHGIVTPGRDESSRKLGWIGLPADLRGRTVLDVGAWDGFFSFEAERRGAERVLAVDGPAWSEPAWGPAATGRRRRSSSPAARSAPASRTASRARAIGPETVGRFDVVLFLGVLYHLKHPWPALERVASVCDGLLIVETHADLLDLRAPRDGALPGRRARRRRLELVGPERRGADRDAARGGLRPRRGRPPRAARVPLRARRLPAPARPALPGAAGPRVGARAPRLGDRTGNARLPESTLAHARPTGEGCRVWRSTRVTRHRACCSATSSRSSGWG